MKSSAILFALVVGFSAQATQLQDPDVSRGEYVARLGNCVGCHTVEDGEP